MPELPEVETSRRGIAPFIEGQKILEIIVRQKQLRWPVPLDAVKKQRGNTLYRVSRRGKYLLLHMENGYWLVHLGMSGSLRIVDQDTPVKKHDHVDVVFGNGHVLRFNDPRRFGCWLFQETEELHPLLEKLGPEPLSDDFDGDYLFQRSRKKKTPVKNFIMNSQVVVGVGNIYASEALFMAGIQPAREVGRISRKRLAGLTDAICQVLSRSIAQGGTTLRDFVNSDGTPGYFKQSLHVYGKEGKPCSTCQSPIKKLELANRSTFFCSTCQS